jgi:DNA-binding transcriptional MocR family regulator
LRQKQAQDLQANSLAQALLVRYLEGDQFERHKRRARLHYRRKAKLLTSTVAELLPDLRFQAPGGGFSLWLEGDFRLNQKRLLEAAIRRGVSFDVGTPFQLKPGGQFALRLCYSSVAEEHVRKGVERLARAFKAARSMTRR